MQGGTGGPLAASGGVTGSLQLNHSGGRLSAWQDQAKCPSHLFCHSYSGEALGWRLASDRSNVNTVRVDRLARNEGRLIPAHDSEQQLHLTRKIQGFQGLSGEVQRLKLIIKESRKTWLKQFYSYDTMKTAPTVN